MITFGMGPKKGPDDTLAFTLPLGDKKLPGIAAEDIGKYSLGVFNIGREYIGKTVGIAGEHFTRTQTGGCDDQSLLTNSPLQRRSSGSVSEFRFFRR